MYSKQRRNHSISDDAEFDDIDGFDYVEEFIDTDDDDDYDADLYDDDFDDNEEDDEFYESIDDDDDDDDISHLTIGDDEIEIHMVCEDCDHKWIDHVSEEEYEGDFDTNCPMCGSINVSRLN